MSENTTKENNANRSDDRNYQKNKKKPDGGGNRNRRRPRNHSPADGRGQQNRGNTAAPRSAQGKSDDNKRNNRPHQRQIHHQAGAAEKEGPGGKGNTERRKDTSSGTAKRENFNRDRNRDTKRHNPQQRFERSSENNPRARKKIQTVETVDDIKKENERLEKEIWLEIANIHIMKLD